MKRSKLLWVLGGTVALACFSDARRTPFAPNAEILDEAHGAVGSGFWFLPPMVPDPVIDKPFNAVLQALVRICRIGVTCTNPIEFTRSTGPGSETLRVNTVDEHYIVNWHTDQFAVADGEQYRIEVFADERATFRLGLADVEIAASGKEAKNITGGGGTIGLVDGKTLPIKFFVGLGALGQCTKPDVTCTETIVPPSGGLVVAINDDGEAEAFAEFPENWNGRPTVVSLEEIPDDGNPSTGPLGAPDLLRQWPLFYEFLAFEIVEGELVPARRFDRRVRIGVCNIESPFADPLHPEDRLRLSLGIGAGNNFRTLPLANASDILGTCEGITLAVQRERDHGGWQRLLNAFAPKPLHAATTAMVVDGGMGGSTDSFESPVGTVEGKPDLRVIELESGDGEVIEVPGFTMSPTDPVVGEPVTFTAVITNRGDLHAGLTHARIDVSGEPAGDALACHSELSTNLLTASLAPDEACIVSRVVTFSAPGDYTATATADAVGDLASEYDETNNTAMLTFRVRAEPDLEITDISISPDNATFADFVNYDVTIRNNGKGAAPASIILLDGPSGLSGDVGADILNVPALNPGDQATLRSRLGPRVAGAADVTAVADPNNEVAESNEDNNRFTSEPFTVAPRIDFETVGNGTPVSEIALPLALVNDYGPQGLAFSFVQALGTAGVASLCNSRAADPVGVTTNHSATIEASGDPCSGFTQGTLTMTFSADAGLPTSLEFQLRGNNDLLVFPIAAFDAAGGPLLVTRSNVTTYTSNNGFTARQETVSIQAASGIARVVMDLPAGTGAVFIDELVIIR